MVNKFYCKFSNFKLIKLNESFGMTFNDFPGNSSFSSVYNDS